MRRGSVIKSDNVDVSIPSLPPIPWMSYACLAMSMILVGTYVGLSPLLSSVIPVMLLAWLRFGVSALAMAPWMRVHREDEPIGRREHVLLFLQSFLGNFLFTLCALYGTWMTGALSAGVVMATIPAAVAVLSWLFLRERLTVQIGVAIGLSAAAVVLLALARTPDAWAALPLASSDPRGSEASSAPTPSNRLQVWGHLLLLAAVVCEASYVVIGKRLSAHVRPARLTAIINLWGFALSTPAGLWLAWRFDFASVQAATWGLFLFYALAASVVTVWLWMRGLQQVPAQQAGVFTVLLPLSSAAIGVLVLNEPWGAAHAVALLLAVAAMLMVTRSGNKVVAA